jgi:hypothetical protein
VEVLVMSRAPQPIDASSLLSALLPALARELAPLIAAELQRGPTTPRHATAKCNPCGSVRGFKAACASGAFETFKLGRAVAAKWEDVERYVESRKATPSPKQASPKAPPASELDEDRRALIAAGVLLRPANDRAPRRAARGAR